MKTNVTFFGTPDFAVPALTALLDADFCDVSLVVTQPDKPIGRHHSKPVPSPVKKIALDAGIPVTSGVDAAGGLDASSELGVLVAYGKIIPKELIDAFPLGILNIHPSLLPKYRGSSPIQAAILNQDHETGVTIMRVDDHMDHGPIVAQERVKLNMTETAGELRDKLTETGAQLLIKTLPDYIAGRIKPKPQNDEQASYTEKLTKENGRIDWSQTAGSIQPFIRAMNPWPGAWTEWQGKKLTIWKASLNKSRDSLGILGTGSSPSAQDDVLIEEVQLEGKKRMPYGEFIRGHPDCKITDFS